MRAAMAAVLGLSGALFALNVQANPDDARSAAPAVVAERAEVVDAALAELKRRVSEQLKGPERVYASSVVDAARNFKAIDVPTMPSDWAAAGLDLSKATRQGDRLVQVLPGGAKVTFTIVPQLQSYLTSLLATNQVPRGGVVLMEPNTGRVLAMVGQGSGQGQASGSFVQSSYAPSASIFKVVTAAALMESAGVGPSDQVCYHGGLRGLTPRNIQGDSRRDNICNNLTGALAFSINSIMAKLAYQRLSQEDLTIWAERFGYNSPIPFELPVEVSKAEFVEDPLERARAAAGFWHTHLSPLHGAMIGAAVSNDGVMMRPSIIESVESPQGEVVHRFEPKVFRQVMSAHTARALDQMMVDTTTSGTARKYFGNRRGFPRHLVASGKTGTLSFSEPYERYTWFVGTVRDPNLGNRAITVSSVMGNGENWRLVGPMAASEAVARYFQFASNEAPPDRKSVV